MPTKRKAKRPSARRSAGRDRTRRRGNAKPAARRRATARTSAGRRPKPGAKAKPTAERRMKQTETLRLRTTSPALTVNNVERSLAWYRDVLGFTVKDRWEEGGQLLGVELVAGSALFMISQDDWKKGRDRVKGVGFRLYCTTVQDVDQLAARVTARGGTLIQEPKDQPWGTRDFAVEDPDGFKITIASERKG